MGVSDNESTNYAIVVTAVEQVQVQVKLSLVIRTLSQHSILSKEAI